jgi:CBS-domain-containing membrane protein
VLLGLPALGLGRPTLATVVFTGLIAGFVFTGATASLRRARLVARLPAGTAGELARQALAVAPSVPLAEAVRLAHEARLHALVVVDATGEP